jgi:hypothetical protein
MKQVVEGVEVSGVAGRKLREDDRLTRIHTLNLRPHGQGPEAGLTRHPANHS